MFRKWYSRPLRDGSDIYTMKIGRSELFLCRFEGVQALREQF
jgi:hypothetical protein